MSAARLAGQAWQGYKNNLLVQDIIETAVMSLGVAGAQALFSEMSPEEIAMSGVVGIGAGMAGRPAGHYLGQRLGRYVDKIAPEQSEALRAKMDKSMADMAKAGEQTEMARHASELMQAKFGHHLTDNAGAFEAAMGYIGRQRGDNIAQAGVGLVAPLVMGGEEQAA